MSNSGKVSVAFTEDMKGFFSPGVDDSTAGFEEGKKADRAVMFHLTITIPDINFFLVDPREQGVADGYIESELYGGKCEVKDGVFRLFVQASDEAASKNVKNMKYQLHFADDAGKPKTMSGHKIVKNDGVENIWRDTSTLYFQILDGHVDIDETGTSDGAGILHILPADFAHQMTTFKTTGPNMLARKRGVDRFFKLFAGSLWSVYRLHLHNCPSSNKWDRCLVLLRECFAHHFHVRRRVVDSANDVSR